MKERSEFSGIITAEKVAKMVANLQTDWNELDQEELSLRLIDLQDKVSLLKGSARVARIEKEAEHLHFNFVFPVALELQESEFSFAKEIDRIAKQILKSNSLELFYELNAVQQQEILRGCA